MDLLDIKGRIARALVESIFRRAGFTLTPVGPRESPARLGREELIPDFFAVRVPEDEKPPEGPARLIEVRYRPQLGQYLSIEDQRASQSIFAHAKRQWPGLMFVFVTDHPEARRSCFQVLDLEPWSMGDRVAAIDLFDHSGLDIYRQNVEEHEVLARRIFALLSGSP
ncbi:MAG TPA: hypothetical protein VGW35_15400 [Methylomirabilota bacterium]|jgi:hypothetical protein|nr:hypothetical protein [Methylomirabilota bacterium]